VPVVAKKEEPKKATAAASTLTSDRAPPEAGRPYYIRGTMQLRMLAISDEDPAAGRSMLYALEGGYKITPQATAFLRVGLSQQFVVASESDELIAPEHRGLISQEERESIITSPFRIRDTTIGGQYRHKLELPDLGDRTVSFAHFLNVYLPSSIASQDRGLYFAPEVATRARINAFEKLTLGADLGGQYRFHKFAEYYGPGGGLLTQFQIGLGLVADYNIADLGEWGTVDAGGGLSWSWQNTFDNREGDDLWRQQYGWDVYAFYTPRSWLSVGVSLEQGAPVVRSDLGTRSVNLFHRDETELAFTVVGTY
jgi:hypothetical protein